MHDDGSAKGGNALSRRELLRSVTRGVLLGGLVAVGARAVSRKSNPAADLSVCRHTCGDCWQRTICSLPEASLARKERRHEAR
jgi:hypothetical protein